MNAINDMAGLDGELRELRALVAEMGGLAEAALDGAVDALIRRDAEHALRIVHEDRRIDALEAALEQGVEALLAARRPPATTLREVLAALKIASMVERVGDYAKSIAKRVPLLQEARDIGPLAILPPMARATAEMVHDALDAFAARDPAAAVRVSRGDRVVDDFYNSLFRALLAWMAEHPDRVGEATHLLFIAKNLERVGDQATNIAEMVYLAATGERLTERGRGQDALAPPAAAAAALDTGAA